jgi:hypothetical protein
MQKKTIKNDCHDPGINHSRFDISSQYQKSNKTLISLEYFYNKLLTLIKKDVNTERKEAFSSLRINENIDQHLSYFYT